MKTTTIIRPRDASAKTTNSITPQQFLTTLRQGATLAESEAKLLQTAALAAKPSGWIAKGDQQAAPVLDDIKAKLGATLTRPLTEAESREAKALLSQFEHATQAKSSLVHRLVNDRKLAVPANTTWVGPPAWNVQDAAQKLLDQANASGRPVACLFNDAVLLASPGGYSSEAVAAWGAQMNERFPASWVNELSSRVEARVTEEAGKSEVAALSATAPRSLDQLIDWARKDPNRNYIIAGLCDLKHPKEISAWVAHYIDVMPALSAQDVKPGKRPPSAAQARETAIANMRFWVNEREGSAPGTKALWNEAIEKAADRLSTSMWQ
ncbi:MAG: hypothetical protein K1X89_15405 [Myxococcaceae bacterium]|nr:hypothetical protein [Myxococcaceae bacterium]